MSANLDLASEVYQSVSEPFFIEEDSPKKKPVIVARPVEESVPELPLEEPNVSSGASETAPIEEPEEDAREEPKTEELRVPPPKLQEERPLSIKKIKKSKPLEVGPVEANKPIERPVEEEKVQPIVERLAQSIESVEQQADDPLDETATQLTAIVGFGLLALIFIRKLRQG